jgi:hypothetical protein
MNGYIVCTDQPVTGAQAEWELSSVDAELVNAGASVRYENGAFIITPAPPKIEVTQAIGLTKLEFLNRFTDSELAAIYSAAKTNIDVEVWLAKFNATTPDSDGYSIYLNDPRTILSVKGMESAGLLATGRAAEILG